MLGHFNPALPYHLEHFFRWHTAAVDLFFYLSGFTLSYVYSGTSFRFAPYLTARVARIYPLYFLTLVVVGAAFTLPSQVLRATYPAHSALSDFVRQVLMVNDWPIIGTGVHWNTQAWSVSIEWLCYLLLFPLLLRLTPPRSENVKLLLFAALTAVSYVTLLFSETWLVNPVTNAVNAWRPWGNALRGTSAFTAGWIAFWSFEQRDQLHSLCTRFSPALWLCFVAVLTLSYTAYIEPQMVVFLFPFIVLAASDSNSGPSRLLGARPLHFLGLISYSIYMVHFIVAIAFARIFGRWAGWSLWIHAALIAATFAASVCSYILIERPARDALRKWRIVPQAKGQMNPG
ncbi:acyltransferase [Bradyrhizobium sp. CCBAU 51753]|nr:acyltransferase [Bradyrhizobium sp. CCBAU 51753]